ncbi:MAG: exodeoxyribonuclease I [Methylococcales bacterium]
MKQRSHGVQTLYWHDYETFGTDPQRDRPVQFAGVRTDTDFNVIDDPLVVYCKPALDYLPHPDACLITGILPQHAAQRGVCEAEFINKIHQQLAQPQTCTLGYNSLRFDDEVTRNCLYRNFYDPYAREWQNGNSRWDLIDVLRAARALRPDGINWPVDAEGRPSFRLELLTAANGLAHEAAHDALSDVYATIAIAKLLNTAQPKLYDFLWQNRLKIPANNLLQLGSFKPVVHVSGKYPAQRSCLAIVLPLCRHPTNANGVIVYDLSIDPQALLSCSAEQIQQRIFTATDSLPDGVERIPLKTVHINKCPVLAPISVIRPGDAQRLAIDLPSCYANIEKIKAGTGLAATLAEVFSAGFSDSAADPDLSIYSGGFFSDADEQTMAKIRILSAQQLADGKFTFTDKRLTEMLFRYRARNYPDSLNANEEQRWQQFCRDKLQGKLPGAGILMTDYLQRLETLRETGQADTNLVDELHAYVHNIAQYLKIDTASIFAHLQRE